MSTKKIGITMWFGLLLLAAALCLPMCGQKAEETAPPAQEVARTPGETLSRDEEKAVSSEFDIEAEESINEDNLEAELAKVEAEINADN